MTNTVDAHNLEVKIGRFNMDIQPEGREWKTGKRIHEKFIICRNAKNKNLLEFYNGMFSGRLGDDHLAIVTREDIPVEQISGGGAFSVGLYDSEDPLWRIGEESGLFGSIPNAILGKFVPLIVPKYAAKYGLQLPEKIRLNSSYNKQDPPDTLKRTKSGIYVPA